MNSAQQHVEIFILLFLGISFSSKTEQLTKLLRALPPWSEKNFKCMMFKLKENAFASQETKYKPFYSCPS